MKIATYKLDQDWA